MNYTEPLDDPANAALLQLLASRLSAAYAVVGRQDESDRWCRVAMEARIPKRMANASPIKAN